MGKQQNNKDKNPVKPNKIHKTLREKLRKKREQLKQHKKQKTERKKQYNEQEQKMKFFNQAQSKQQNLRDLKMKKITKYIQKFIDIYEDNLDDFYDMFKTFDEAGQIDIAGLENKALYKCLKKLFKYLPLKKQNGEFKKVQTSKVNLERLIRQKVSQSMEYYLENGSRKEVSDVQSSAQENAQKNHKKSKKHHGVKSEAVEDNEQVQPIRLYKKQILQTKPTVLGPCISSQDREQLAEQFEKQLQQIKKAKQQQIQKQEDDFDFIFNKGKTRSQMKAKQVKKDNQGVPQHLMAAGSALIGQKMEIDQQEIQEYNKLHRPKTLVEIHKELHGGMNQSSKKGRKPFNRERDVSGESKAGMSNSMFFDFKNKMSKPSKTNQFL